MAKGVPIQGKDPLGKAKYANVTAEGDLKVQLSGASGNIISPATEDKLEQVRQLLAGVATENKLEQARMLLDAISTKDFATSSKQDALNIAVEDLKNELILVKSELATIKANQLSGDQKVQVSGHIQEFAVASWDDLPPDSVPVGSVAMLIGTNDIRQTDGEEWLPI